MTCASSDVALYKAFRAALALTGSIEAAERAVLDGMSVVRSDLVSDTLLVETARSAIQRRMEHSDQREAPSILPLELQGLFLLSPIRRDCFVLRVLIGLTTELISRILNLSKDEIDETLYRALLDLPGCIEFSPNERFTKGATNDEARKDSLHRQSPHHRWPGKRNIPHIRWPAGR